MTEDNDLPDEIRKIMENVQSQIKDDPKINNFDLQEDCFNPNFAKDAQELLKNWAKVESESEQIKQKVTHQKTKPSAFLPNPAAGGRPKTGKPKNKIQENDKEEDFKLALEMVGKFRKNRNMINEEIYEENRKLELVTDTSKPIVKPALVDPSLTIEMRHAKVDQMRKQREKDKVEREKINVIKENVNANPDIFSKSTMSNFSEIYSTSSSLKKSVEISSKQKINFTKPLPQALPPINEDPLFVQQVKEIRDKRVALENDSKRIAEESRRISESVRQQAEVFFL